MLEVNQEWYYIEEIYHPYFARKINHIVDLETNENTIEYEIGETPYVGFKVRALNSESRELAFIETFPIEKLKGLRKELGELEELLKNKPLDTISDEILNEIFNKIQEIKNCKFYFLKINLTPLNLFQNSIMYFSRNIKHVKLNIEIIHTKPVIEDLSEIEERSNLLKYEESYLKLLKKPIRKHNFCNINKMFPRLTSVITIKGKSAPEITLILPPGWTIEKDGKGIFFEIYEGNDAGETVNLFEKFKMDCFTTSEKNKLSFKYLIDSKVDSEAFYKFSNYIKNSYKPKIVFTYTSTLTSHIKWVCIIQHLFGISIIGLFIMVMIDIFNKIEFDFNLTYMLSYIIILLTFSFYYNSLIKDGYVIPFMDWFSKIFYFCLFSVIFLFFIGKIF